MYTILIEGCFKLMRRLQIKQHHIVLYKMLLLHNPGKKVASFVRRVFDINHIFNRTNDLIDQLIIVGL
ncbi:hypothetical protein TELCIR_00492 [Teladorsagia circumcincta]|uniref:NR LBD domain-containing protein n=1 Tax=Teladorsagia circumcincta TaxID=45464 RepID=A0A2G9V4J5_TELCI|nr:hypothetical protein TELCIR_00492 [Teladorsagia circumcincta]